MTKFQIGELTVVQGRVRTSTARCVVVCLCLAVSTSTNLLRERDKQSVGYGTAGDGRGYKSVRILFFVVASVSPARALCSLNGNGEGTVADGSSGSVATYLPSRTVLPLSIDGRRSR